MNIAVIIAGGCGRRMGQDIPKQFLNVEDKPVIVYTMEVFQRHPSIDGIIVVCVKGWEEVVRAYAKQFNVTKLIDIVNGGECGQASIKNGIMRAKESYNDADIVLIHDAIRPMVSEKVISENIEKCMLYGNASAFIPCADPVLQSDNEIEAIAYINRDEVKRVQTPQSFRLGDILLAHKEAEKRGITNSVTSSTLYIELGKKIYFSTGSEKNIKLTTPEDFEIFKALLKSERINWMK